MTYWVGTAQTRSRGCGAYRLIAGESRGSDGGGREYRGRCEASTVAEGGTTHGVGAMHGAGCVLVWKLLSAPHCTAGRRAGRLDDHAGTSWLHAPAQGGQPHVPSEDSAGRCGGRAANANVRGWFAAAHMDGHTTRHCAALHCTLRNSPAIPHRVQRQRQKEAPRATHFRLNIVVRKLCWAPTNRSTASDRGACPARMECIAIHTPRLPGQLLPRPPRRPRCAVGRTQWAGDSTPK